MDHRAILALRDEGRRFAYTDRDTMLYALASGMGRDPLDEKELPFIFEGRGLVALPTMAVVVARSPMPRTLPLDWTKVLHGSQSLILHRPLPAAAELVADTRVTKIIDKGAGRGALIVHETKARLINAAEPLFTVGGTIFARGDGGFGGPAGAIPAAHPMPRRAPDTVFVTETRRDQALLYRLTGDHNPLHADPWLAKAAGFPIPILHGLCTYSIAGRAVLASVCDYDPTRIGELDARFTAPVFPGDQIRTDIWIDGNMIAFRCRVEERGVVVIDHGKCVLNAPRRADSRAEQQVANVT